MKRLLAVAALIAVATSILAIVLGARGVPLRHLAPPPSSLDLQAAPVPPPCNASHEAYFRCATATAPYCEQGRCLYPAPASAPCAPGYRRIPVPSASSYVCGRAARS